jgi:hypothetical protein
VFDDVGHYRYVTRSSLDRESIAVASEQRYGGANAVSLSRQPRSTDNDSLALVVYTDD